MRILALDQARIGAWSVFAYETGELVAYDSFSFDSRKYTYAQAILHIEELLAELIEKYEVSAVFLEDIQLRVNAKSFKELAQLQGVLINYCEKHQILYDCIQPSTWQSFCGARGRTSKEIKAKATEIVGKGSKQTKILSIQFVKNNFHIDTDNDNIADAICIGHYVCENVCICKS